MGSANELLLHLTFNIKGPQILIRTKTHRKMQLFQNSFPFRQTPTEVLEKKIPICQDNYP